MKSQTDRILALLRHRGDAGVTALDSLLEVGSFRLAARVWDLRRAGYDVEAKSLQVNGSRVARYVLHESEQLIAWVDL